MTIKFFIITFIVFSGSVCIAQNFSSQIKKGKVLEVAVVPVGDAYANPDDEFTLKIKLVDSVYYLELYKKGIINDVILSDEQALEAIVFFENWKASRCRWGKCGLTYSNVSINIGHKKKKFRDGFYYGYKIIDKYFHAANID